MRRAPFAPFLAYVILFHLAWIAWPYLVYPRLVSVGVETLTYALLNISLRLLVWVAPVFWYLTFVDRVAPLQYLKLTGHVRRGLIVAAGLTAVNLLGSIARYGLPHPGMDRVTWNSLLGTSLLIGAIEEIPYRGFMLQKFSAQFGFPLGTLITSLLFVSIHLPGWMMLHTLNPATAVSVFVLGVVLSIAFKYSESLWAAIVAHSANDFLSFLLFRL